MSANVSIFEICINFETSENYAFCIFVEACVTSKCYCTRIPLDLSAQLLMMYAYVIIIRTPFSVRTCLRVCACMSACVDKVLSCVHAMHFCAR